MAVIHYFSVPALSDGGHQTTLSKVKGIVGKEIDVKLETEACYNIQVDGELTGDELKKLLFIIGTPFQNDQVSTSSVLDAKKTEDALLIEIGPRLNFSTAWSTNAVSICQSAGLSKISRIERSRRFLLTATDHPSILSEAERAIVASLHDRMTECRYLEPLRSFDIQIKPEAVYDVDIMGEGKEALKKANKDLGLAFDDWDLDYYTDMFTNKIKRNPTSVECFDLAQSNSEHSRHWFFKGRMVVDGEEMKESLFDLVMKTQDNSNPNNVIKFSDNSSAIRGNTIKALYPVRPGCSATPMIDKQLDRHIIFTAETHNFPTGVAPFSGATTGTGGRIRDVQCAGKGSHVVAGTAGYCFGNLHIPGYDLPWEDASFVYPSNMARPLEVAVEASNGASDYGNKFGEPVLAGFARSFGMVIPGEDRREWVKPIMFSGGMGSLEEGHVKKDAPVQGMKVVKLGGPIYRIGVGGGAASSIQVQGDNTEALDFGAVQRGDAEMEQKLNRVVRACIELGDRNPIKSIHDQGAGGNGNVLKEICEPAGAVIRTKAFQLGDPTLTTLELWGAEYQESNAILVDEDDEELLSDMCRRERCPVCYVGEITGDGKIRLEEEKLEIINGGMGNGDHSPAKKSRKVSYPVDLDLEWVLGKMPRKVFNLNRTVRNLSPLDLPSGLTVVDALDRVLRLPSVASKRYLTNKVDRSVTGLVAQQQCVGPLHTPLADVAVTALSHFETVGSATAIGEQPIKGLVNAASGARMAVAESLTNLVFARVTALKDVKCSGNWMWPAKLPGEGAALYDACQAMGSLMSELGIAVDGGKDSLSMAARVEGKTVKAPGALVISTYVGCPDITATVTPDLKCPQGQGTLLYVDLSCGQRRLGGSALAQCYNQIGDNVPDVNDASLLAAAFNVTQDLIKDGLLTAGHDISDGGLITCLLEMAFAGNYGINVELATNVNATPLEFLFSEELGLVLETNQSDTEVVCRKYADQGVPCSIIGYSCGEAAEAKILINLNGSTVLEDSMPRLRDVWEATSFQLERLQTNQACVVKEEALLKNRKAPPYKLTFDPQPATPVQSMSRPKVAVIREEGSNGDREMLASFHMAGFEAWDVNMQDLASGTLSLKNFRGVAFVGGFSFADVMGSAKGWAAAILYNPVVRDEFDAYRARTDTFSLGVCNGCQLMGLLGWVAPDETHSDSNQAACKEGVLLDHNDSERYESRFVTVKIQESPAIMLQGMQDSILGIWVAHGEGKMKFAESIHSSVLSNALAPVRYVDDEGAPTTQYPLNPNGSPDGIAALCSPDGRHLAIMPHPERCTQTWQWPWMPADWRRELKASPWLRIFENAYKWCLENEA